MVGGREQREVAAGVASLALCAGSTSLTIFLSVLSASGPS